ncbi:MAG: XrtV sorting system accessory protein [Sphingomonadaceae bacterium]
METAYDWITVGIFAGLIVLFLQRSVGPERDRMWPYFVASVACAVINQIGNKAVENGDSLYHVAAIAGILAILAFVHYTLRPFGGAEK